MHVIEKSLIANNSFFLLIEIYSKEKNAKSLISLGYSQLIHPKISIVSNIWHFYLIEKKEADLGKIDLVDSLVVQSNRSEFGKRGYLISESSSFST